uniref:Prospero homeobox 3 n=1 Tax=Oreochromis niloticus TaxID=8128 RepID=A0A669DK41_ORENI
MDSPTDLFDDSAPQIRTFAPTLNSTDLAGIHPQANAGRLTPAFRPPGFPLIHHLLQPGGGPRRIGGLLNTSLSTHRHLEDRNVEEDEGERDGHVEQRMEGGDEGAIEGKDDLLGVKKRHNDAALAAEWNQDILKVKRMKLESRQRDGEADEGGKQGGREGRRREREELKEQLEEARERLQALQEKVWRAFGEKHMAEDEKKRKRRNGSSGGVDGREEDVGLIEEEDMTEGMYDEEDIDGGEMEKESFSLLSESPFDSFHKRKEELQKDRERRMERGRGGGGLHLEGVMEGSGLWLDCGGLVRGDWDGGIDDESEEGGQKFAAALKLELGSAVARVIDRVLRLYTEMTDYAPSSPPAAISFLPSDPGSDGGKEKAVPTHSSAHLSPLTSIPLTQTSPCTTLPCLVLLPFLTLPSCLQPLSPRIPPPPLSTRLQPPPLLPPLLSLRLPSSPASAPPLPLPLLHYSMQQLFSRSLHHPQLPHLPSSRKDYLNSDPFLEFSSHPSSHPSFPPLPLLGHLDPSLARELYLTAGGISFCQCEGLSPCHLKKAKLMFFYTRYPSSNTLKTYFPDVKFNRCVTSQMIKWFSNFREFFYIQMERFARQAVREALTRRESQLRVGRDTELYRILNMHYNKSNIYQVPERFIEVSEVALREFYSAIWTGRDSDPCWKKGIYKIICKLDSPLPDAFRLPGCPVG